MPAMYPFDNLVAIVYQLPLAYCKPCGYLYPVRLLDDSDLDRIPEGGYAPPQPCNHTIQGEAVLNDLSHHPSVTTGESV